MPRNTNATTDYSGVRELLQLLNTQITGLRLDGDTTPSKVLLKSELEPPSKYKAVVVRGENPYIESVWSPSVKAALEALLHATMEFASIYGTGGFFTEGHYAWELERTKANFQILPFAVPLGHDFATGFDAAAVSAPMQTQAGPSSQAQPQGGKERTQNWDGRLL
ncbi:hypothetical protein LTR12_008910 [Friedmanniomyces endolithicus]|nr:hypothetical protein LTR74_000957 [Friedmanniomyces endolithicus]KAK1816657.1 hypothetical protein LTR12_008910 [Friedmanniomyces endolithicus]